MRAWVIERPDRVEGPPLRLVERPLPEPGPGEVRLAVRACGVCRTDLHEVEGELLPPALPMTPGHQVIGIVDALGPGVEGVAPGERRGVFWLHWACGECPACRRGEENLCARALFTGLDRHGGYAEAIVVPAAFAIPIPESFSDEEAAPLLCAGTIGYRALRLSEARPGERLALFGFGASAHLAIQVACHQGCEVVVYTRSPSHQELARRLGAAWAGAWPQPGETLPEGHCAPWEVEPPAGQADRAIVFAPAGGLVPVALRAVRPGGTVAVNAVHMSDVPSFPYRLLHGERTLRSVAHVTRRDAEEFLHLAAAVHARVETRTYPFEGAPDALRDLKESAVEGAAVLRISR